MINTDYLRKIASAAQYRLKDYQQRVVDKVITNSDTPTSLIALHSMGSGKTLTALSTFDKMQKLKPNAKMLYIVPAPLVARTPQEMKQYGLGNLINKVDVLSYEAASKVPPGSKTQYDLVAIDEAHRLRNAKSQRAQNIQNILDNSKHRLLLTGTAGYNHPADMYGLINRLNPDLKLPEDHTAFMNRYAPDGENLRHKDELAKILNKYIDKYEVDKNNEHFPSVSQKVIDVPMSPQQEILYQHIAERDLPEELRAKLKAGIKLTARDAQVFNMFMGGTRQASNTGSKFLSTMSYKDSPKIMTALKSVQEHAKNNPNFRGVVYSNYLEAGVLPYAQALQDSGIRSYIYTGSTPVKEKEKIIREYNKFDNKPKALILSSAGGEGLDLKRTNLMQVLEPHWNEPKLDQAKARAVRYDSHADLPKSQRHVDIEEYHSVFNKQHAIPPVDTVLSDLSYQKNSIVKQMNDLIGKKPPKQTFMDSLSDWNPFNSSKYKNLSNKI